MFVEIRTYTFKPGTLRKCLELVENFALPIQRQYLGHLVGYFVAETGQQNQVVQMWAYESLADREGGRAALWADPDWVKYADQLISNIVCQESRFLKPIASAPLVF